MENLRLPPNGNDVVESVSMDVVVDMDGSVEKILFY